MTETLIFERHYTLGELAKAWHISRTTLEGWFRDEPGVIRYGSTKLRKGRHRTHVSVRIPESVARRVYLAHTGRQERRSERAEEQAARRAQKLPLSVRSRRRRLGRPPTRAPPSTPPG